MAFEMHKFDIWCLMVRIEKNHKGIFDKCTNSAIEYVSFIIDDLQGNLIRAALATDSLINISKDFYEFINDNSDYFKKENKEALNGRCEKFLEYAKELNSFEK